MAVTILERPQGYILGNPIAGSAYNNGIGGYQVDLAGQEHGLVTGDFFYISSAVESYNGFFKVGSFNATQVQNLDIITGLPIPFIKVVPLFLYPGRLRHGWSCVHLPITFRIESDLFPYGSPLNTILSFANDGLGNTDITPTASLSGSFQILGFVRLEGTSVDGIYEILDNSGSLVIDLPYDAGYTLAGGTMSVYYPNYHIRVQIYGGLTTAHYWEDEKPYELISTLKLIPDNSNEIHFSIANELKKQVKSLTNNTVLDTLPNNIDAFTMFYITTQESYDLSDGSEVTTFEGSIVSDKSNFEGFAVNARLPFKNIHSGYLSDYLVDTQSIAAKFLTLFETPVIFDGYYFDLSALINFENIIYYDLPQLEIQKILVDAAGNESAASYERIENLDVGVYRLPFSANCAYKQLKIQIQDGPYKTTINPDFEFSLVSWENSGLAGDEDWVWDANFGGCAKTTPDGPVTAEDTKTLRQEFGNYPNVRVRTEFVIAYPPGAFTCTFNVVTFDGLTPSETLFSYVFDTNGTHTIDEVLSASLDYTRIGFWIENGFPIDIDNPASAEVKYFIVDSILTALTEQKTLDIACNCNDQGIEGTQITWLNYLGGMESYVFTAQTEHQIDIKEAKTRLINIFPTWPTSYGEFSNTMRQETSRIACFRKTFRSQLIPLSNLTAMQYIKTSPLVQIMESQTDLRTVLVDTDSFTVYNDNDKEFSISFAVEYTDYIPAQSL